MTHKGQPFFFDANVFDPDDPRYTPDPSERPKLEYTQNQLAQAKESAFEAGKIAGLKESQASLMQDMQHIMQKIERDIATLYAAEDHRATLYEAEAVHLTLAILRKIFPVYTEKAGVEEIKAIIQSSLAEHHTKNQIVIEVSPVLEPELSELINKSAPNIRDRVSIHPNPVMGKQACKILWMNGGVTYDLKRIADKITLTLQESLAVYGINGHDTLCEPAQNNISEK